jgi:hypothetical protein
MSCDYYVDLDPTCNNPTHNQRTSVCHSANGWKILLSSQPERGLTSWAAWRQFLVGRRITDEYGKVWGYDEFVRFVEGKQGPLKSGEPPWCHLDRSHPGYGGHGQPVDPETEYHDPEGYDMAERVFG